MESNQFFKNILTGISSILDVFRPYRRKQFRKVESDAEAIYGDWCKVGDDLRFVMGYRTTSGK